MFPVPGIRYPTQLRVPAAYPTSAIWAFLPRLKIGSNLAIENKSVLPSGHGVQVEERRPERTRFVRERSSVREFSDKQNKKLKQTLDTAGVVRDGR
jgi:hypothetical protein